MNRYVTIAFVIVIIATVVASFDSTNNENGVLEVHVTSHTHDVTKHFEHEVCLGLLRHKDRPMLQRSWDFHSCSNLHYDTTLKNYDVIKLQINQTKASTYVIVKRATSPGHDVIGWVQLPLILPGDDVTHDIIIEGRKEEKSKQNLIFIENIEAWRFQLKLICHPNRHGPLCKVTCHPPTSHHVCDDVTGELRCAPQWSGKFCTNNVFMDKATASSFVKSRPKRANSWLRFEEFQPGNIERECEEERCSREEAREAFEDDALTTEYWTRYTDPNQCLPNPCRTNHTSRCEDLLADYRCHCFNGYFGKNCQQEMDPCSSSPCHNGALCGKHTPTSYSCVCSSGYRGHHCDVNIDDCAIANCGDHGQCVDGINNYTCVCDVGFTGLRCEADINECENNPCENGGNCSDHVGFYTCACALEYEGTNCDSRINPCVTSPCINGGVCAMNRDYSFNCSCPSRFTGVTCEYDVTNPCASQPCNNDGVCYVINSTVSDVLSVGNHDNSSQDFHCLCNIGFGGKSCDREIPACEYSPCPINATCVGLRHQYICVCPPGYRGDNCDVPGNDSDVTEQVQCELNPCLNEARCIFYDNTTTCLCREGYNGTHCDVMIDYCVSSPCINGGECIASPGSFYCNCRQGFHGSFCENDIDECAFGLCRHNATCNNTIGSFECICGPYHVGRLCEIDYDACTSSPCHNGGLCVHRGTIVECKCLSGYGNTYCDDVINPCDDITNPCLNDGICSRMIGDPTQANCTCTNGYYGHVCGKVWDYCTVRGNESRYDDVTMGFVPSIVARTDCGFHGDCVSENFGFRCRCHFGYEGDLCEQDQSIECHYGHYDVGTCRATTCLSQSCRNDDVMFCDWSSSCITSYTRTQDVSIDPDCVIMTMTMNKTMIQQNTTTALLCHKLRLLPNNGRTNVTVHCALLSADDVTAIVVISWLSMTSSVDSYLVGAAVYQQLERKLGQQIIEDRDYLAEGIEPLYDAIISLEFQSHRGHVLKLRDDGVKPTSSSHTSHGDSLWYIPVILGVSLILLVTCFVYTRRRHNKKRSYSTGDDVTRNDVMATVDNASMDRVIVSSTRVKWFRLPLGGSNKRDEFVNPLFVDNQMCNGLPSHSDDNGNAYVTTPQQSPLLRHKVEQSTIDYDVTKSGMTSYDDEVTYETINISPRESPTNTSRDTNNTVASPSEITKPILPDAGWQSTPNVTSRSYFDPEVYHVPRKARPVD
ncbi:uncharacterized protein gla2 isoform X2 [Ciona intestinalis]